MSTATTLYCTRANLVSLFGEREQITFADKEGTESGNTTAVDLAIAWASARIEGKLSCRYTFPLSPAIPDSLRTICCHLVRWYLYSDAPTKGVNMFYTESMKELDDIAAGRQSLGSAYDSSTTDGIDYQTNTRQLTRSNLDIA